MRKGMIIDVCEVQPGDKLSYYDTSFALTGEAHTIIKYHSSIKVIFEGGVELQTHAHMRVFALREEKRDVQRLSKRHTTRKGSSKIVSFECADGKEL